MNFSLSKKFIKFYGDGNIHHYPLERLLIFRDDVFESLKKELKGVRFFKNQPKPPKPKNGTQPKIIKPIPDRFTHEYEPTNVWVAYDGARQRWRRMNEWFARSTIDDRQNVSLKNIMNQLNP